MVIDCEQVCLVMVKSTINLLLLYVSLSQKKCSVNFLSWWSKQWQIYRIERKLFLRDCNTLTIWKISKYFSHKFVQLESILGHSVILRICHNLSRISRNVEHLQNSQWPCNLLKLLLETYKSKMEIKFWETRWLQGDSSCNFFFHCFDQFLFKIFFYILL